MISYATITGTRSTLAALREAGWRLFITPFSCHWDPHGFRWAVDNGAWTCMQRGIPFDEARFLACLTKCGDGADFVVVPDIVAGGMDSLAFSLSWLPRLERYPLVLIPVQDGMTWDEVRPHLSPRVGILLGGTTSWKLRMARYWGTLAREVGCYYHFARVNSKKRIQIAMDAGADSVDGTSVPQFPCTLRKLDSQLRQGHLWTSGF